MTIPTFLLFLSCILFSALSFFLNAHSTTNGLKIVTMILGFAGLFFAGYVILAAVLTYACIL